jgi:phage terminase large subunit
VEIELPNNWTPRPYQLEAWRYLQAGGKHAELIWHRRAGKDDVCLHHAAIKAMERVANYWHMLPEASQARKAIWGAINPHTGRKRVDEAFPLELRRKTLEQEMKIEFVNGSTWQVMGSDNFNSLVGSAPAGIVYSEWALANPSARAYLRPILAENNGWQLFITTPRGKNHAYQTYQAARKTPGVFAQVLSARQTGALSAEKLEIERLAYIQEFGIDMGQALYDQEYGCDFDAAILGAVLGRWMGRARQAGRVVDSGLLDPDGAPVCISSDLGFRDTASWWFWQPRRDGFAIVGYLGASGMDADDWIQQLTEYVKSRNMRLGKIWLPHDARNKTFATKHTPLERFLKEFGGDRVRVVPQTKIADRINAARRVVERCWFDEGECADGVSGLTSWRYEYDQTTRVMSREPVHDWASHPGDAFSYGAQMMEEEPPAIDDRPKPVFFEQASLNDLWAASKTNDRKRI